MSANVNRIILERFKFAMSQHFSQEMIDDGMLTVERVDRMGRDIALRFRADIFGQKLDRILWKMPADWKEAVKERFFPKWLLKRYPVKYKQFKIDPIVLYPDIKLPDERHYFRYERVVEDNG